MNHNEHQHPWDVLLVGGAAGTGKSSLSYDLAHYFRTGLTEVDDLHLVLETMTSPEQFPDLHYWANKPASLEMNSQDIVALHIRVARLLMPAIIAVINNHLEDKTPIILEGDYLLPEIFAAEHRGKLINIERVRAVFLYEDSREQLLQNFLEREPAEGEQLGRALVSQQLGQWLKKECAHLDVAALPARPWADSFKRIVAAVT
jgi:2-phosphoglycerate kinase